MMRLRGVLFAGALALASLTSVGAQAQRPPNGRTPPTHPPPAQAAGLEPSKDFRAHFGLDLVDRLLHAQDPDERLRGIVRAEGMGTTDAMARLIDVADPQSPTRSDARAVIEVARALAAFDKPAARAALVSLVNAPNATRSREEAPAPTDADQPARMDMARTTAALALAQSGDARAEEALLSIARVPGVGQRAALAALGAYPPKSALLAGLLVTPATIRLAVRSGDLRGLDALRQAARSMDVPTRAAGIVALGEMGDGRGLPIARAAMTDPAPPVRVAAAKALVYLDAPERFQAVTALILEDATLPLGIELARNLTSPDGTIEKALMSRAESPIDPELRRASVAALGTSSNPRVLDALARWLADPVLSGDAAHALGRSPLQGATATLDHAMDAPATRRLAVRAAVVRALVRDQRSSRFMATIGRMAESRDGAERALGVFARLALGKGSLEKALGDPDPRVRRQAALASLSDAQESDRAEVLARVSGERDAATRTVLLSGLILGDDAGRVTTFELRTRTESRGPEAPLTAMALTQRSDAKDEPSVRELLRSPDPLMRAHVALGLGSSSLPDASGKLAAAYAYEPDAAVRTAVIVALASPTRAEIDRDAPVRQETLRLAAHLDPDEGIRLLAARALAHIPPPRPATPGEIAWLRAATLDGTKPPRDLMATFVRADGISVPIVFDDDGYALIPGIPAGAGRLILAPRVPSYEASAP